MLSINTNISSLITQRSIKDSTEILNTAIERMTTGYKINHAKDNAANYSISTNMTTQLNAYDVAADNVAMGMDLVTTASDIISQMQDKASRLHALSTQARNGTYGAQSMNAINSEANAIMSEIFRLYNTSQYNGIDLFNRTAYTIASHLPQAGESGFIDETALTAVASADPSPIAKAEYNGFIDDPKTYTDAEVAAMTPLTDAVTTVSSGQKYSISSVDELVNLAELVNSGVDTTGVEFVLGADIDLSSISNWTPIGDYSTSSSYTFKGTFDGNGHVIKNLTIDNESKNYQGLFGYATAESEIKNINLKSGVINGGQYTASLIAYSKAKVINCKSSVDVVGNSFYTGGLIAYTDAEILKSIVLGSVSGQQYTGGLTGVSNSDVIGCFSQGDVIGKLATGGLIGTAGNSGQILNSYALGNVSATSNVGGLVGQANCPIEDSYACGDVTGVSSNVGGLVGYTTNRIVNCYAEGDTNGCDSTGGLVGYVASQYGVITNSYASGDVIGENQVGGLIGATFAGRSTTEPVDTPIVLNSYATGNVYGSNFVGGLIGYSYTAGVSIENSFAQGNVSGDNYSGGLIGETSSSVFDSYACGNVSGNNYVGGLVGRVYSPSSAITIENSSSYSSLRGKTAVGGLIGGIVGERTVTYNYSTVGNENINLTESSGNILINNCTTLESKIDNVGIYYEENICDLFYINSNGDWVENYSVEEIINDSYDLESLNKKISCTPKKSTSTTLQVGTRADSSCCISFDPSFILFSFLSRNIESDDTYNEINNLIDLLNEKQTELGAIENRLESALESIEVNINNLTSSRSTIRDADIAEESSAYIRGQILQQAAATLMSTANQNPMIALQLL